ncbi:MAG: hypothetical protein PGN33_21620 [Methylobacterium radiotolerans]
MSRLAAIRERRRTHMQETPRRVVIRTDPDFEQAVIGGFKLVEDAYARGIISWMRRCALLDLLASGESELYERRTYVTPHSDPDAIQIGVYLEPTWAFLIELGLLTPEMTAPEQADSGADRER